MYNDHLKLRTVRYQKLVALYHADLFRFAYWLSKDKNAAEEIIQESYLRAWKYLDKQLDENAEKSWLLTIVRRENARYFSRKTLDIDDVEQNDLVDTSSLSVEQNAEYENIRNQIALLAPEYREPLIMQVLLGLSSHEIAEQLMLTTNTVNTRLFRAREQLKHCLS
ncbi:sigma-70 family RNA polymerase sigma factor [Shewanella sp. HN-41]|uniref:sigma-70 family RNA polymerase sigma factor n=1 Tax=Shewanella sp. HN-41 TaxID=327275 RepID=UPI00021264F9|nr:sigma-70 family RNA polymerase sigma factor [Shewanella sp. HN-41]EGM69689.1 RNA polymerase sigma-70 factor, ECF subfamily [Shewanella sp. HN-41]